MPSVELSSMLALEASIAETKPKLGVAADDMYHEAAPHERRDGLGWGGARSADRLRVSSSRVR